MKARVDPQASSGVSRVFALALLALLVGCGDDATQSDRSSTPVVEPDATDLSLSFDRVDAQSDLASDSADTTTDVELDRPIDDQTTDQADESDVLEDVEIGDEVADVEPDETGEADSVEDLNRDTPETTDAPTDGDLADTIDTADGDSDVATDIDLGVDSDSERADAVGDPDADASPACPPAAYETYFAERSAVAAATIDVLAGDDLTQFCAFLDELEETAAIAIEEPIASQDCVEPTSCGYISLTETEQPAIYTAKLAHSIWLDRSDVLPWHLSEFSAEELRGLFDKRALLTNGAAFFWVVDHSPSYAYGYMTDNDLIGDDMEATLEAVLTDLRTTDSDRDFIHGLSSHGDPTDSAYTLQEALETFVDRGGPVRISRKGCHSMSRIVLALLRSVNIPGLETRSGEWFLSGHSSAVWPVLERVLTHGDNLYSALIKAAAALELTPSTAIFEADENIIVCGENPHCLAMRHASLVGMTYPSSYTRNRCCRPDDFELVSCEAYIIDNYSAYLTGSEVEGFIAELEATCD